MEEATFWGLSATGWTAIGAVAAVATGVIALVAAVLALRQFINDGKLRKEQARPYVVVDFVDSHADRHLVDFVIRNDGRTAAYDIEISWEPAPVEAKATPGHKFADAQIFRAPMKMLAPQAERRFFFDSHIDRATRPELPTTYTVRVDYRESTATGGDRYVDSFILDLSDRKGGTYLTIYNTHHVVQRLEQLNDILSKSVLAGDALDVRVETRPESEQRKVVDWRETLARGSGETPRLRKPKRRS